MEQVGTLHDQRKECPVASYILTSEETHPYFWETPWDNVIKTSNFHIVLICTGTKA